MNDMQEVTRQSRLLVEAQKKHADAKVLVSNLKGRVGPTSHELCEARNVQGRFRREVVRVIGVLKKLGLTDDDIERIKNLESDSVVA
jgi:hypothetical protein